jgi:tRNA A-37 threonylcarbamoyl transferase component Bud32
MAPSSTSPAAPAARAPIGFSSSDLPRRFGRYVLLRRIAKGGMGEVMLASTLGLEGAERPIIIKTIRSEHRTDASFKARFLDEARVQAQLTHPGVAQVIEATTDDESGESYVAVEYVEGRSLGDVRARALAMNAAIAWSEAVAILTQAAEALAHVHERVDAAGRPLSIVHRDLSPQNLMVAYGGDVKIIDFGTARGENRRCHTVAGVVFAKPGYVAPEVANGDSGDFRVDQYALGVILWELCAGRRFLQGEASEHMASVAKNERNLPPIAAECGAPAALDAVIAGLTSFDREDRYRATRSAARELGALLAGAPPLAGGERGVRARIASLMDRLFDGEAVRTRREFQRLVAQARHRVSTAKTPPQPSARAERVVEDETAGLLPGTRYRVLSELGRGAKSVVHEAEHVDLGPSRRREGAPGGVRGLGRGRSAHRARRAHPLEAGDRRRRARTRRRADQRRSALLGTREDRRQVARSSPRRRRNGAVARGPRARGSPARGARASACGRRGASGSQAGQRRGRRRRQGDAARLRARALARRFGRDDRRRRAEPRAHGGRLRYARVHGTRAGVAPRRGRWSRRPLRARCHPLRARRGPLAVHAGIGRRIARSQAAGRSRPGARERRASASQLRSSSRRRWPGIPACASPRRRRCAPRCGAPSRSQSGDARRDADSCRSRSSQRSAARSASAPGSSALRAPSGGASTRCKRRFRRVRRHTSRWSARR